MNETSKNWELQIIAPERICTEILWSRDTNIVIAIVTAGDYELVLPDHPFWAHYILASIVDQHDLRRFGQHAEVVMRDPEGLVAFRPLIQQGNPHSTDEPREPDAGINGIGVAVFLALPLIDAWRYMRSPWWKRWRIRRYLSHYRDWSGTISAQLIVKGFVLSEVRLNYQLAPLWGESSIQSSTGLYHTIFASYAREDLVIVQAVSSILDALGVGQLQWDLKILRSGDLWSEVIFEHIREANSFQLFWSDFAKKSKYVQQEWKHALALKRSGFIKPVYWTEPMPKPPRELRDLHFFRMTLPVQ
jgi:hypothetical protein